MNDLISQLLQVGPGLAAGATGHGAGMQAFMESFQKTSQMLDRQAQEKALLAQQQQDRQRNIARQTEADRVATEQRNQGDALQRMQIPGQLAQMGGAMESPDDAKHLIETVLPGLMNAFGPETMAMGQPAVEMAQQTITARQQRQMKEFVADAEKGVGVAENPDSDPLVANLPAHISKMLGGKTEARLSELQKFAQMYVGKPQGKTRVPAASGSMEEFSDPTTTPERKAQILADRKAYGQADDRPLAGAGGLETTGEDTDSLAQSLVDGSMLPSMLMKRGNYNAILARANKISLQKTGKPYNAARAQTEFAAANRFVGSMNGPQQQRFRTLAGTVTNTIDEVKALADEMKNSGVPLMNRAKLTALAQTQGNTPAGQLAARYLAAVNTLKEEFASLAQGGYAPTEAAWNLANQQINGDFGQQQLGAALSEVQRLINYRMQAFENLMPYGVNPQNPVVEGGFSTGTPPPTPKFKVGQKVRSKKTGEVREVTGVQPDGTPVLGPVKQ